MKTVTLNTDTDTAWEMRFALSTRARELAKRIRTHAGCDILRSRSIRALRAVAAMQRQISTSIAR